MSLDINLRLDINPISQKTPETGFLFVLTDASVNTTGDPSSATHMWLHKSSLMSDSVIRCFFRDLRKRIVLFSDRFGYVIYNITGSPQYFTGFENVWTKIPISHEENNIGYFQASRFTVRLEDIPGKLISGTSDPTDDQGEDGEMYYNTTTKNLFGPKTAGSWDTEGLSLKSAAKNNVYVSKNGNDTTADGTITYPYATVQAANASIIDASSSNPYTIQISAGEFIETVPIVCKPYVSIRGSAGLSTIIRPASDDNIFVLADQMCISMMTLDSTGITSPTNSNVISNTVAINSVINNLYIKGGSVGVNCTVASFLKAKDILVEATTTYGYYVFAGQVQLATCLAFNCPIGFGVTSGIMSLYTTICNLCTTAGVSIMNGASVFSNNATYINCVNTCIRTTGTGPNSFRGGSQVVEDDHPVYNISQGNAEDRIIISSGQIDFNKISAADMHNIDIAALDVASLTQEPAYRICQELSVGLHNKPREAVFGQGDSYVDGLVVLTTDSTEDLAGDATLDGIGYIDVSAAAADIAGATFGFQGSSINHAIYVTTTKKEISTVPLKFWGIKVAQLTGATNTDGTAVNCETFVLEYWNGTSWKRAYMMATHGSQYFSYADNVFVRDNADEHIRFGISDYDYGSDWATKTINGTDAYWVRIRIAIPITGTAPVFNRFKISPSRTEINPQGYLTHHGSARYRETLNLIGEVYGELGGVSNLSFDVGTAPYTNDGATGWQAKITNGSLNSSAEGISIQVTLPRGIDTSFPVRVNIALVFPTVPTADSELIVGFLPIAVEGAKSADLSATRSKLPVLRPAALAESVTSKPCESETFFINTTSSPVTAGKCQEFISRDFFIPHYHEGDVMFFRFATVSNPGSQMGILYTKFEYVKWTPGTII